MKIALSVGHSFDSPGASGFGIEECKFWSKAVRNTVYMLEAFGHEARVFNRGEFGNSISREIAAINRHSPDLVVSLHLNSADDANANGFECWAHCRSAKGKKLASDIVNANTVFPVNRGVKLAGPEARAWSFLNGTSAPAVLVEAGFVSNRGDANLMAARPAEIAENVANGILRYLNRRD